MEIKSRPISELKPAEYNPRQLTEKQFKDLQNSFKNLGTLEPAVININPDRLNVIISGHQRLKVAESLGMTEYPCFEVDFSEAKEREANIRMNRNTGDWDMDLLANNFEVEDLKEWGFDDLAFESDNGEGLTDEDAVPDEPEEPVTKLGDLYILGEHRLLCGDSTSIDAVEKLMDGEKIDVVFADPPYGIDVVQSNQVGGGGATKFGKVGGNIVESKTYSKIIGDETTETAQEFYNLCISLEIPSILIWGGNYFTDFLPPSRCWVIWDKEMTGNFSEAEMAWTSFEKGGVKVFKHLWNGLSREGNRKDELATRVHPTQKPVGLFENIFEKYSDHKIIFDGFGGSGSTLIACEKTNRKCRMMELDPKYCDVIVKRWEDFTGKQSELVGEKSVQNA